MKEESWLAVLARQNEVAPTIAIHVLNASWRRQPTTHVGFQFKRLLKAIGAEFAVNSDDGLFLVVFSDEKKSVALTGGDAPKTCEILPSRHSNRGE